MSIQQGILCLQSLAQPTSIIGSKYNLTMHCANPICSKELLFLREETLNLLAMEAQSDDQFQSDDRAFAMRFAPSRFFRFLVSA
jgi:hypothetical protein